MILKNTVKEVFKNYKKSLCLEHVQVNKATLYSTSWNQVSSLYPLPANIEFKNNFSTPCYQVGFCTELISTGATHAIQLGFAPIVYPPGQYK
jgi:hypothetical protein